MKLTSNTYLDSIHMLTERLGKEGKELEELLSVAEKMGASDYLSIIVQAHTTRAVLTLVETMIIAVLLLIEQREE